MLKVHGTKSKVLALQSNKNIQCVVRLNVEELENVGTFIYLGRETED